MNDKTKLKPLSLAIGAAFASSIAISPMAAAVENPFAMNHLSSGYQLADNTPMGQEGNCGANKAKAKEANCGANKAKAQEANCGANKAKAKEANCGANKAKPKAKEGKCGETKCGANKK